MFQLAILQNALPSGAGYSFLVIALGALSGALVAIFQTLFARMVERREETEPAVEARGGSGAVAAPGPAAPSH